MQTFFSQIPLFQDLSPSDLNTLQESAMLKNFAKNDVIFTSGDESQFLYILKKGVVKLYNIRKGTSKEEIVCLIRPGGFFCLSPLLTREVLHINARAVKDSEAIVIPKKSIQDLISSSHPFAQRVISFLACTDCNLCERVCDLSLSTTKERLAKYLLKEYESSQRANSFPLSLNQSQLASYLGTVRETLSRDLAALKKAHVLAMRKGKISVMNPKELALIARGPVIIS